MDAPPMGIAFEKTRRICRFVPYALLLAADYNRKDELRFIFASGLITIHGENLDDIWKALQKERLDSVSETENSPAPGATWVREIIMPESQADHGLPPFPSES
jgi:hypothetical protein